MVPPKAGDVQVVSPDDVEVEHIKAEISDYDAVVQEARESSDAEVKMTLREGFKKYPAAIIWSAILSTAIIMEGFDVVLLGSFLGYPEFVKAYGTLQPDGKYNISPAWQTGLQNGALCGEIIGLFINGIVSERFGYRKTMIASLSAMICFIFIPFFAKNLTTLVIGEVLQGIPWGIFQTLTTAYAAEVCPTALRPILTSYVNACWVIGQLLASGVLRGLLSRTDEWAYRIPFALQWIWPAPLIIACIWAPESPWWLVRQGRTDDARKVMKRLTNSKEVTEAETDGSVALMIHTDAFEKSVTAGTSYWDCFKGVDLRRTEIACGAWIVQNWTGSAFMGYSTYFLQQAGFSVDRSFDLSIGQYAIGLTGTVGSWFLMRYLGRRTIYLGGMSILFVLLMIIGFLGLVPHNQGAVWAVGSMLLVFTFIYDITIGPVCYCLVAEIGSTRLRAKTVVLARNAYNIAGLINSLIMPRFLNVEALNAGAKTGWFWAGMCALCILWCYFRVPEPKGRTPGELDVLFSQKVSARKFSSTAADQFGHHSSPTLEKAESKQETVEHVEYTA
ncbi:alpha glucoside transporter [Leucosporidium creatinivorum]|uniref:Alpha glucoside transporter n=1 Tax=Leucosporidium creatinivorum TaxID=106004 RepID=A0A1Y2E5U8_9BASI|nr:alpha glucoside transporter [Leucosporidium creatinivorum]